MPHSLGDFRPGTVSAIPRRCGRPTCHCAQPDDPGHPQFRLLRKVKGKSVSESFATPSAFRKAAQEVAEFHRFQDLTVELTAINEQICQARSAEPEATDWSEAEKNGCCDRRSLPCPPTSLGAFGQTVSHPRNEPQPMDGASHRPARPGQD